MKENPTETKIGSLVQLPTGEWVFEENPKGAIRMVPDGTLMIEVERADIHLSVSTGGLESGLSTFAMQDASLLDFARIGW